MAEVPAVRRRSTRLDSQDDLTPGGGKKKLLMRRRSMLSRKNSFMISSEDGTSTLRQPTLVPRMENSYRTEPPETQTFNACAVQRTIAGVLRAHLNDAKYNADAAPKMALKLSGVIKAEVKSLNMPRYKIVTQVLINERKGQALNVCSRSLWEDKFDNYACATYVSDDIYAVGIVHGMYFD